MWELLRHLSSAKFSLCWAVGVWLADFALTSLIIWRVPFTNVDWEAYMEEVDGVLHGEFDYSKLKGATGPLAYPAGFCWVYGAFRALDLGVGAVQVVFGVLYMSMLAAVLQIYRHAGAPGWLLVLCAASKRVHSIFVLRLFNDAVAQVLLYAALLLFLQRRELWSALAYSLAVSVKMQPLLFCPAVGLCLVLSGGWSHALWLVGVMLLLQLALAAPFLAVNPRTYLARAFGGPGHLQHAWSVNWRFLPEYVFTHRAFPAALLFCHLALLVWFAHRHWIPGGWTIRALRRWRARGMPLGDKAVVYAWFGCNFVGVACLRTLHFQYAAWYFHTVPFLAWLALRPDDHRGLAWALRCAAVVALVLGLELAYLRTARGLVKGPDGREWETNGVPTALGSMLLQVVHGTLLVLLAGRGAQEDALKES